MGQTRDGAIKIAAMKGWCLFGREDENRMDLATHFIA